MLALRFDGERAALDRRAPEPAAGEGWAVVRVRRAGVSEIDVRTVRAAEGAFVGVLGQEFVGEVESLGEGCERWASLAGARVVSGPWIACGVCDLCSRGLPGHCRDGRSLGAHGADGCLAEKIAVPARGLARVPDEVDDDRALFAPTLARAIHAAQQLRIEHKPFITVLGDNVPALLTAQMMARLNASVRLVGRSERRIALCEKWGIKHRALGDVGRRADQDIVVDCTGDAEGFGVACAMARPRGTILLALGPDRAACDLRPVAQRELSVVGSRDGSVAEALGFLRSGEIDVVSLITRRMRLTDGVAALEAAAREDQVRVVVDC